MVVLLTDPRNSTGAAAGRSEDTSYFGPVRHASGDISTEYKVLEMKIQKLSACIEQPKLGKGEKSPRSTSRVRAEARLAENQEERHHLRKGQLRVTSKRTRSNSQFEEENREGVGSRKLKDNIIY